MKRSILLLLQIMYAGCLCKTIRLILAIVIADIIARNDDTANKIGTFLKGGWQLQKRLFTSS
ncbi:MAG: hypothetical protein ABFD00_08345 [Chloroherpetonaceae bacterium]